jgi:transposase
MTKKYVVTLADEEQGQLLKMIGSGTAKARTISRARILLKANEGWQDKEISQALDVSIPTIERVRKRFVFEGFEASLKSLHSKRIYSRKLDGEQEARLVALVCSSPPEGYVRWSLRLLADRVVQMKIIDSISHETVRQVLGDNELKPWRAERNGVFQQRMQNLSFTWKTFWVSTNVRLISAIPQSGLT